MMEQAPQGAVLRRDGDEAFAVLRGRLLVRIQVEAPLIGGLPMAVALVQVVVLVEAAVMDRVSAPEWVGAGVPEEVTAFYGEGPGKRQGFRNVYRRGQAA
jgi:hypothetical protein